MVLDVPTLTIVAFATCAGLSVAMLLAWRLVLHDRPLFIWGVSQGLLALGFALFPWRGVLPDVLTIVVPNELFAMASSLTWLAVCRYRRIAPFRKTIVAVFVPYLSAFCYFALVSPDIGTRIVLVRSTMGFLGTATGLTLLWPAGMRRTPVSVAVGVAMVLLSATSMATLLTHAKDVGADTPLAANQAVAMPILFGIVGHLVWGLGVVMMVLEDVAGKLRRSSNLLQDVLDAIPSRVFWKDRDSRYLGCNRQFAMDAGVPDTAALIGRTDRELCWAAEAEHYRADDLVVIARGQPRMDYEERMIRADGAGRFISTSKLPLHGDDGRIIGTVGAYDDITERKARRPGWSKPCTRPKRPRGPNRNFSPI